ncbi:hypothetical protein [Mariprofundus sp. EBB-1]|uniref:hypothetical protein n=1 Tax=Mariprofundus sp. EBB-1 TaxID=2650971 RepID=UPI0012940B6A|nr:hypothetical protein [Mariprofundus sp. EBB-1]
MSLNDEVQMSNKVILKGAEMKSFRQRYYEEVHADLKSVKDRNTGAYEAAKRFVLK